MSDIIVRHRRTGWDVALGLLLLVGGLVVLGHTVLATAVSVLFLGWLTLFAGISALVGALFRMFTATLSLLGTLLAIQLIVDGVTILVEGRVHVRAR